MRRSIDPPRVFIVDEAVVAWTLSVILRQNGFDALAFTDPIDAIAASSKDSPDILIAAISLPNLSGTELAIILRDAAPGCRVFLFSSASAEMELLEEYGDCGQDFKIIGKPIHPDELLRMLREG